jgi:hypothetical protein
VWKKVLDWPPWPANQRADVGNSDGKDLMTNPAPQPDLAWHLRRLLEVVTEAACGLEGRWRWLAGPLALLTWFPTR